LTFFVDLTSLKATVLSNIGTAQLQLYKENLQEKFLSFNFSLPFGVKYWKCKM